MGTVLCRRLAAGLALAAVLTTLGCGVQEAAARTKRSNQLKSIGLAYHNCNDQNKKGPANADELAKFGALPDEVAAVKTGEIVVQWNAVIPGSFPAGAGETVLAYEKDVPTKGGMVLMGDATVRTMTAQEFGAAAKPTAK
jgi:hypothetical protein